MDDCQSDTKSSNLDVLDGFRTDLDLLRDRAGLVCEEGWLGRLKVEALDDMESDGVWYGLPIPNSAARLMDGVALPSRVRGRTRLILGGGGREVSGPMEGLRDLSPFMGVRDRTMSLDALDGLRSLSGRGPGADGVRNGISIVSLGLGNVPARLLAPKGGGSKSSSLRGGPKPS